MIEIIKDDLLISLNTIIEIKTKVINEIERIHGEKKHYFINMTEENKEDSENVKINKFQNKDQSNCSINDERTQTVNNDEVIHNSNLSHSEESRSPEIWIQTPTKNSKPEYLKTTEKVKFSEKRENNTLRSLQTKLKSTLKCLEFLKHGVTEKINLLNADEKNQLDPAFDKVGSSNSSKKLSSENISSERTCETTPVCCQDDMSRNSTLHRLESEEINTDQIINEIVKVVDKTLNCSPNIKMGPLDNGGSSNNLPLKSNNSCHDNVMISLISDEESNSDCSVIFITRDDPDGNITDASTINTYKCSTVNSENSVHGDQAVLRRSESDQSGIIEENREFRKRKVNDLDKSPAKKKKDCKENSGIIADDPPRNNLYGEFYKVKLTNLHESVCYTDIVTLLQNAGLEFIDILLIHNSHKSYAEVSFTEASAREKAVSLDKTLSYFGMKIKIRPLEQ